MQQHQTWKKIFAESVTSLSQLCEILELDLSTFQSYDTAQSTFPLRVPRGFIERMQKGDRQDPLLLQVLPLAQESEVVQGYSIDPLQEKKHNPLPGVLHKYHGRVLFTLAGECAVHCRYCFRRHFPYNENRIGKKGWDRVLQYIRDDHSIAEVILSGGDPLLVSDSYLEKFVEELEAISHVQRLRIHSRLPIVIPERITSELTELLIGTRLQTVLVVHANHAREIDTSIKTAFSKLRNSQVTLLNQSVLLRGVNDSVPALVDLSKALFDAGILPYYLHRLDKVQGSAHFEVAAQQMQAIYRGVLKSLPGYLVPKLVSEQAGLPHKMLIPLD